MEKKAEPGESQKHRPDHDMPTMQKPIAECPEAEDWDTATAMCMPLALPSERMTHIMVHGNGFVVGTVQDGPRGRDGISAPHMIMADVGSMVGESQFVDLNLMLTAERWLFPEKGYPELLQTGEQDEKGKPYLDAQHPHSSPIMGLTVSDTIKFGSHKDHIKIFFSPRGQATDGPIAFMHRPTGMVNPDAPLGHHTGQDVSHITSTVVGTSLKLAVTRIEASLFNGREPEPTKVDLPMKTPNSGAVRLIQEFTPTAIAMVSYGVIREPEGDDAKDSTLHRYSASIYSDHVLSGLMLSNAVIFGGVNQYEHPKSLLSLTEEFLLRDLCCKGDAWGRIETLQRTPSQLQIQAKDDPDRGRWVTALTLGFTKKVATSTRGDLGVGFSATQNFLPEEYRASYEGQPWAAKVFIQASGMNMWMRP